MFNNLVIVNTKGQYMNCEQIQFVLIEETNNDGLFNLPNEDEETEIALETLVDLSNELNVASTKTGITNNEALVIETALEHLSNQLNLSKTKIFSLENYSGHYNNVMSSKIALENIASKIIEIIKKIANWVMNAISYVVKLISSRLDAYKGIADRARDIKLKASLIGNKQPKKKVLENEQLATFFTYDGKVVDAKAIIKNYKTHCQTTSVSFAKNYLKNVLNGLNNVTDAVIKDGVEIEQALKSTDALFKELLYGGLKHLDKEKESKENNGFDLYSYDYLFGQKKLIINLGKQQGFYKSISAKIDNVSSLYGNKQIEVLSTSEVDSICTAIDHEMLFGNSKNYKDVIYDLEKVQSTVSRNCNKLLDGDITNGEATFSVSFLRDIVSSTINLVQITNKYDIIVNKKCLQYCEASLDMY
jgi:ribosomal protein S13